jgi:hypothetical protein
MKLSDPQLVAAVVDELDARRLQALAVSKYLESKKVMDVIDNLKRQLYDNDRKALFEDNVRQLAERHREAVESFEATRREWQERKQQLEESCRAERCEMEDKHEAQHADLEQLWTDPSTQRKFTKRSAQLLQRKAVEKYMVLAGQLEAAEEVKRANRQSERQEAQNQYQNMMDSFENVRAKLVADQASEMEKLRMEQELKLKNMLKDEEAAMEVCHKRIAATQRKWEEESDFEKFTAKKFKKSADCVLPTTVFNPADDLPKLSRARGMGKPLAHSSICDGGQSQTPGLVLPPLQVRRAKHRRTGLR